MSLGKPAQRVPSVNNGMRRVSDVNTRSRFRRGIAAAAVLGVCLALNACGSSSGSSNSASGHGAKKIGVLILVQADEAGARALAAINKQAAVQGWKTVVIDANYDPTKEIAGMDSLINQNVDGIIAFATDNELLRTKIKAAADKKIPVMVIAGGKVVPGLTWSLDFPDEEIGAKLATELFTQAKAEAAGGQAKVVEMVLPEAAPCRRREAGFDAAAKNFPDVNVTKYHIDGTNPAAAANNYFSQYLQANPNTSGILSCWDVPLTGGLTAAKKQGLNKLVAMGINGTSDSVQKLQNGDPNLKGLVAYALAEAGYDPVVQMKNLFDNKSTTIPASHYSKVRWDIYTPANVPKAPALERLEWLPKGWSGDYWK